MTVGDVNSNAKGSGARYNEGKPDYSLLPLVTLEEEIKVWMFGAKKYAPGNWMKGMDWNIPFSCMMRHMARWQSGEENDPETGLSHLAHAMCNLRMLMLYSKTYPEGDHRFTEWLQEYMPRRDVVPTPASAPAAVLTESVGTLSDRNLPFKFPLNNATNPTQ